MIRKLFDRVSEVLISSDNEQADGEDREASLRLATAVLLIDVARADHVFDETEFEHVLELVERHFELAPEDAAELVNLANEKAEHLISSYDFTRVLHEHLDDAEKERIVAMLWQVAYADGRLDKYEDSLVLKVSDLLYVNRARVMRLKHDARQAASS